MPLEKNGHPWVLAEFPDEIEEDDAIFRIRFTGEVRSVGSRQHEFLSIVLFLNMYWFVVVDEEGLVDVSLLAVDAALE